MRHKHAWQLVRRVVNKDPNRPGHNIVYEFYECLNPGCPKPHKMEIVKK